MSLRRYKGYKPGEKKLFFYAPLTSTRNAQYQYDGSSLTPYIAGTGTFSGGEYQSTSAVGSAIIWNCKPPKDKGLTFSLFQKITSTLHVWNNGFGFMDIARPKYSCLCTSFIDTAKDVCISAEWLDYMVNLGFQMPLNTRVFVTYTIQKVSETEHQVSSYLNGVLIRRQTLTLPSLWLGITDNCRFSLGRNTSNNFTGSASQLSCYEALNDSEVLQLYQRGGVPFGL